MIQLEKVIATNDNIKALIINAINEYGVDVDLNFINVSRVTNMRKLFNNTGFSGDISSWDVSNVFTMSSMFENCSNFDCDISLWDVSNVERMSFMFNHCYNFNQDLSKWNVSNVQHAQYVFNACSINETFKPKFKF